MFYNTKFLKLLNFFRFNIINKSLFIKKNFVICIFLLFLGFICGNLFGTFLIFFRYYIYWDGFIILLIILLIEFINYLTYIQTFKIKNKNFFKFLNFYKMGLLLGFFTDSFKVGS
jgi:hypothetical protein